MTPPARPNRRSVGATYIRRFNSGALGLPDHGCYITVSQSEFSRWYCPRHALFSVVEGMRTRPSMPMLLGAAWDAWKRDVWTWWKERDQPYPRSALDACVWCDGAGCETCNGTGDSALKLALDTLEASASSYAEDHEVEQACETVARMADGWLAFYEGQQLDDWTVAGVQVPVARAVPGPAGTPYTPMTYLTDADPAEEMVPLGFTVRVPRWRLSRTGEHGHAVRWPWYQLGVLDVVLRHRSTNVALVVDDKATRTPGNWADAIRVDPQLPGYCWMLEPVAERLSCTRVAGYTYEIASTSRQQDPDLLKPILPTVDELKAMASERGLPTKGLKKDELVALLGVEPAPAMSRASTGCVPSWRYLRALEAHGIDPTEYEDHIDGLRARVDVTLYLRGLPALLPYSAEVGARYSRELYAKVEHIAASRRAAALATDPARLDVTFPRVPVCRSGFRCPYEAPCLVGPAGSLETYTTEVDQVWLAAQSDEDQEVSADHPGHATSSPAEGLPGDAHGGT